MVELVPETVMVPDIPKELIEEPTLENGGLGEGL